jgi:hypothetical protein
LAGSLLFTSWIEPKNVLWALFRGIAALLPLLIDSNATKDTNSPRPTSWGPQHGVWKAILPAPCHIFGEAYDDAAWVAMKKFAPEYAKYDENAATVSVKPWGLFSRESAKSGED